MKKTIALILIALATVVYFRQCRYFKQDNIPVIKTKDGRSIAYDHYKHGFDKVIIVAHGFYNNKDTVLFKKISKMFSIEYDVICFDFRGHGKSSGFFSWTAREGHDLHAIISYAKQHGYTKIGLIGFSLGAAVSLIESSRNADIDSVIAVSCPYDIWKINCHFWRKEAFQQLLFNISPKGKGKGIRPGNPFRKKTPPISIVSDISPTPVLFLHGEKDWLIRPEHSKKLFKKAGNPKQIEIIKDAGHAEFIYDEFPEKFEKICLKWFRETIGTDK